MPNWVVAERALNVVLGGPQGAGACRLWSLSAANARSPAIIASREALHGLEEAGLHIRAELITAIALPVVAGTVWLIMHRAREYLRDDDDDEKDG